MKDLQLSLVFPKSRYGVFRRQKTVCDSVNCSPELNPKSVLLERADGNDTWVHYKTKRGNFTAESPSENMQTACERLHDGHAFAQSEISQEVVNHGDMTTKTTRVTPELTGKEFKSFQRLDKDGYYSVARQIGDEVVGGYEMPTKVKRTFAEGLKGKLQKAAMAISTDANGCERPVLRKIGGFMFDILKKI